MFNIENMCKKFWYDTSMYSYMDTLMKVTADEPLVCNSQKEIHGGSQNVHANTDVQNHQDTSKIYPRNDQLKYDKIRVYDPSQTFWDDPNMYVDDPGLEALLSLPDEEFLVYNGHIVTTDVKPDDQNGKNENPNTVQINDGKPAQQICMYPDCGKLFIKESILKMHMRRHTGVKPYLCVWPKCSWSFSRSDELHRHYRSHSGVKPYGCKLCAKRFARTDHLVKHVRVHEKYTFRRRAAAAAKAAKAAAENRTSNKNDTLRFAFG